MAGRDHDEGRMNAQEIVAANVAARGYRDGWTAEQFVARQLCKMTEELGEALWYIHGIDRLDFAADLPDVGEAARIAFDDKEAWNKARIAKPDALRAELADMLVVLFAAAAALDFDVVQAAIDKSSADVARGVR